MLWLMETDQTLSSALEDKTFSIEIIYKIWTAQL